MALSSIVLCRKKKHSPHLLSTQQEQPAAGRIELQYRCWVGSYSSSQVGMDAIEGDWIVIWWWQPIRVVYHLHHHPDLCFQLHFQFLPLLLQVSMFYLQVLHSPHGTWCWLLVCGRGFDTARWCQMMCGNGWYWLFFIFNCWVMVSCCLPSLNWKNLHWPS